MTLFMEGPSLLRCSEATVLHIASFLSAIDMLRLQLSATKFAARSLTLGVEASAGTASPEPWSLISEAARCRIIAHTAEQQSWVPRRGQESWLGLLWELERLCLRLSFSRERADNAISMSDNGSEAALVLHQHDRYRWRTAPSDVTMRAGRHYAVFTILDAGHPHVEQRFGVVRPSWSAATGGAAEEAEYWCYDAREGSYSRPTSDTGAAAAADADDDGSDDSTGGSTWSITGLRWENQQAAVINDRVGLLLDLDEGSMTVFKNDERLGVMVESGLSGEYCWAAGLYESGDRFRVESQPVPAAALVAPAAHLSDQECA